MLYSKDEIIEAIREELTDTNKKIGLANGFRDQDYEFIGVVIEAIERIGKNSINNLLPNEDEVKIESARQCSREVGMVAHTQVYWRMGAIWAIEKIKKKYKKWN